MSPSVSPWNEARRKGASSLPALAGETTAAYRSPGASAALPTAATRAETSAVISSTPAPEKVLRAASTMLFWSRFVSSAAGSSTSNLSPRTGDLATTSVKDAAHSCRKMTSASAYCSSRIRSVMAVLLVESEVQREALTSCHASRATRFSMCTRMASKMAQQRACSGRLMASSSSVRAGYFARGMGLSIAQGRVFWTPPPFAGLSSSCSNMNAFQAAHHCGTSGRGCA
mmetsp:Transcript_8111/g.23804  ORF Transcript_8111/g.23804 Transcript_8111/m.23804 type:complete len:228 (+) Transcript_8111:459-1142(+)